MCSSTFPSLSCVRLKWLSDVSGVDKRQRLQAPGAHDVGSLRSRESFRDAGSRSRRVFMVPTWGVIDQIVVVLMADGGTRLEKAKAVAELIRSAGAYRWVGLYDVGDEQITAIAWTGAVAPAFATFPLSQGLSGDAVRTRAPVIVEDVSIDPRYVITFPSTKSEIIVPVLVGDAVPGTIDVESERVDAFSSQDVRFLQDCARAARQLWSLHETDGSH